MYKVRTQIIIIIIDCICVYAAAPVLKQGYVCLGGGRNTLKSGNSVHEIGTIHQDQKQVEHVWFWGLELQYKLKGREQNSGVYAYAWG